MFKIINLIFIFLLLLVASCKNSSIEGLADTTGTTTQPTTTTTPTTTTNLSSFYFNSDDGTNGGSHSALWKTDGTTGGTVKVTNAILDVGTPETFQNKQYFEGMSATPGDTTKALWKLDANTSTATQITDPAMVTDVQCHRPFGRCVATADRLYFVGTSVANGANKIFTYDGTTVSEITGGDYLYWDYFKVVGTRIYFQAKVNSTGIKNLWEINGTTATEILSYPAVSSNAIPLVASGGKIYFYSNTVSYGRELMVYDPAAAHTGTEGYLCNDGAHPNANPCTVIDLTSGSGGSSFGSGIALGGKIYLDINNELFMYNPSVASSGAGGSCAGSDNPCAIGSGINATLFGFSVLGTKLFVNYNDGSGNKIGYLDGTTLTEITLPTGVTNTTRVYPQACTTTQVCFNATHADTGVEAYITDGTSTTLLKDINVGAGNSGGVSWWDF